MYINIFVNIIQFVAAVQNCFERYGGSGVVDFPVDMEFNIK